MNEAEKIIKLKEDLARSRRELASYKVAATRVGDQLTEISELHQQLTRSRREIELILETTADAMRMIDRDFKIIWSNKAMEDFCGLSASGMKGRQCYEIINTDRCGTRKCLMRRAVEVNRRLVVEEEVNVGGTKKICRITASPFRDDKGEVSGILEDFIDITEQKKIEVDLRESEERYRMIFESANDVIVFIDRKGKIIDVNRKLLELAGYRKENYVGKNIRQLAGVFTRRSLVLIGKNFLKRLAGVHIPPYEVEFIKKDGEHGWAELGAVAVKKDNKVIGVLATLRDITERLRVEKAMRESEYFLRSMFDSIQDGLSVLNLDLSIRHTNNVIKKWYGEELPLEGKKCFQVYQNRDEPCDPCPTLRCFQSGKTERDVVAGLPGSRVEWLELFSFPMKNPDTGEITGVVEFVRDITNKRRMEEEIFNTRKLKSVGVLAGGIAHDFNNILAAIMGNISLLELDTPPGTEASRTISRVEAACLRARDLTQQLLTFSKGGVPIKEVISPGKILREATGIVLHGSNVKCIFRIPEELWPVDADSGQIGQVISNLVINADQAMPEGGEIKIRAENMKLNGGEIPSLPGGRYVKITIEDFGIGISSYLLKRIFDPYFTTKQKGSGLGLATVYSIIEKHSGKISVSSSEGRGTVFTIVLPASASSHPAALETLDEVIRGSGKVLIMDDEEDVLQAVRRMTEKFGYQSVGVRSGDEALEKFIAAGKAGEPFRVVILDLTIKGGQGGVKVLESLREIDPDVKAIVSSGYSTDAVMAEYRREGFQGMVAKPYKAADLSRVLHEVISG